MVGAAARCLLPRWAPWPSALIPAACDHEPRPLRGRHRGFPQLPGKSMAATNDYYQGHLGSSSSNGSCALYPGEAIPHHPGVPRAQPGHWWGSFFFGKSSLLVMATVLESPEHPGSPQASRAPLSSFTSSRLSRVQPEEAAGFLISKHQNTKKEIERTLLFATQATRETSWHPITLPCSQWTINSKQTEKKKVNPLQFKLSRWRLQFSHINYFVYESRRNSSIYIKNSFSKGIFL